MRDNRKRECKHEHLKIFAALAVGVMLTGNAFLRSHGGGPLIGALMQPIQSIVELSTPAVSRTALDLKYGQVDD